MRARQARERCDARIGRPGRPGEGGHEQDGDPEHVEVAAGAHEQPDAEQADGEARDRAERQADAEERAVEHRHEERHARDEERRDARADAQLGPGDAARVDDEEESADDRRRAPLAQTGAVCSDGAAARRPRIEERAGDQKAGGEHEKRRQGAIRDRDREIGRSPDEVDGAEGCCQLHVFSVPGPTD